MCFLFCQIRFWNCGFQHCLSTSQFYNTAGPQGYKKHTNLLGNILEILPIPVKFYIFCIILQVKLCTYFINIVDVHTIIENSVTDILDFLHEIPPFPTLKFYCIHVTFTLLTADWLSFWRLYLGTTHLNFAKTFYSACHG